MFINKSYFVNFSSVYQRKLKDDIADKMSECLGRLFISMISGEREEDPADPEKANTDAKALQTNIKDLGTEGCLLNSIVCSRSYEHLLMVFWEYKQLTGQSILSAIDSELSGDLRTGMLSFAKCVENMPRFFAEKLHQAMKGIGTDEQTLIRIIATRCEMDMKRIKRQYQKLYEDSLEEAIVNDTSGTYMKLLITLIKDV
ncbi:annexin-B12-like [Tachypleus tridentatus]|uniref:annexin-B12-like n=1 Tax=Tachypleus tridentatus TaxID=6853 RepID=UPI003FD6086D